MSVEGHSWNYQCEECQELDLIKRRCAHYRIETLSLRGQVTKLKDEVDQLRTLNARFLEEIKVEKGNVVSIKQDLEKMKKVAKEQKGVILNYETAFNLMKLK